MSSPSAPIGLAITAHFERGTDEHAWRLALSELIDAYRAAWGDRLRWSFEEQAGTAPSPLDDDRWEWTPIAKAPSLTSWLPSRDPERGFELFFHSAKEPERAAAWSLSAMGTQRWDGGAGNVRVVVPTTEAGGPTPGELRDHAITLWERLSPTHGWAGPTPLLPMEPSSRDDVEASRLLGRHDGLQLDRPVSLLSMRLHDRVLAGSWLTMLCPELAQRCPALTVEDEDLRVLPIASGVVLEAGGAPSLDVRPGATRRAMEAASEALGPIRLRDDPRWFAPELGGLAGDAMVRWLRRFERAL